MAQIVNSRISNINCGFDSIVVMSLGQYPQAGTKCWPVAGRPAHSHAHVLRNLPSGTGAVDFDDRRFILKF